MTDGRKTGARLDGLDMARFFAFVGMVVVNFKIAMEAEGGSGLAALFAGSLEGRAAATFVVLAGIGLGLAGAKRLDQTIWVTLKRALFLLAIGLLNMTIFDADILHYYAFYFLFGAVLLPLSSRALWAVIGALNIGFVAMILLLNYDAGWNWESYSYDGFWTPTGFIRNLFFNGWHPVIPWLGFLLFGIVLSRLDLGARGTQIRLALGGALAFALAEGLSAWLTPLASAADPELAALVLTDPVPPMPLYTLAGLGAASLTVGLCLWLAEPARRIGLLALVTPAGRQTLTLYLAHILIGMGTLEALGMLTDQTTETAVTAALIFCILAMVYALIWARFFSRGPVEAVMRKLAG
ncbi:MAG: DUF418 domain-containing protein [Silicimonas sp.]|nr:DUF418 domain-containing protein [Silicimonas sp.]